MKEISREENSAIFTFVKGISEAAKNLGKTKVASFSVEYGYVFILASPSGTTQVIRINRGGSSLKKAGQLGRFLSVPEVFSDIMAHGSFLISQEGVDSCGF